MQLFRWRNEPLLYLICGKLILETRAVINPAACVFRLRFMLCQRGIELGGQMCQLTASLRPLSLKSYDAEKPVRIHSSFWWQKSSTSKYHRGNPQVHLQRYNKVKQCTRPICVKCPCIIFQIKLLTNRKCLSSNESLFLSVGGHQLLYILYMAEQIPLSLYMLFVILNEIHAKPNRSMISAESDQCATRD